jgi:hypothetical protein
MVMDESKITIPELSELSKPGQKIWGMIRHQN